MRTLVIIFCLLTIVSCKNDQSDPNPQNNSAQELPQEEPKAKQLVIEIDLEMSVSEDIRLMALNTFLNNGKYIDIYITQKINANETTKVVKFEMPENISPDNFVGISFGPESVKEIKINSIYLSYGDLSYNIPSENILNFFKTNKYLDYDETSKVFKTKRVEGNHNPILILRQLYIDKIQGIGK